ncbi:MAG: hypothetical protein AAFR61_32625 [Bacteroidota bacterium]
MNYRALGVCLFLVTGSLLLSAQTSKEREKAKKQYWKKELRQNKSINHQKVRQQYPEMGWLSGLWCREGESDPSRSLEMEGPRQVRVTTRGFTATAHKTIHKPEAYLFFKQVKVLDKPVMIENKSHYDLWYAPKGAINTGPRYVYVERIRKISDTQYAVVYRKNYTLRDRSVKLKDFFREESPKLAQSEYFKEPKVYTKCK